MISIIEKRDNNIDIISMKNNQLEVVVSNFGCTVIKVLMKDHLGNIDDVVLGYDDFTCYQKMDGYLGALVGRVCNRIAKGTFTLNNKDYHLAINNGPNHLHGGIKGFSYQVFDYEIINDETIVFHYVSKDNEEGYPGTLSLDVTYSLVGPTLKMHYHATSDKDTLINITNHSYFNLSGHKENIDHHLLKVNADQFLCVDNDGLTTHQPMDVKDTPFDFNDNHYIKDCIYQDHPQLKIAKGYDHHYLFNKTSHQVILRHPQTHRQLIVSSTLPGAQIYSANFLDGRIGKNNKPMNARDALCIETQYTPDAIHSCPDEVILKKGEVYDEETSYTFELYESNKMD